MINLNVTILKKALENEDIVQKLGEQLVKKLKSKMNFAGERGKVEFDLTMMNIDHLKYLQELTKADEDRGSTNFIGSIIKIKENPKKSKISNLKALKSALQEYLKMDFIRGWVFKKSKDGIFMPWLIVSCEYSEATKHSSASVSITMVANKGDDKKGSSDCNRESIRIFSQDIHGHTIESLFTSISWLKESESLIQEYDKDKARFIEIKALINHQLVSNKSGIGIKENGSSYEDKSSRFEEGRKFINDESQLERVVYENWTSTFLNELTILRGLMIGEDDDSYIEMDYEIPHHTKLYLFDLNDHKHIWVHISNIDIYEWKSDLKSKLVLPEIHHDLIEILAGDMGNVMEDVVDGKSGGTTILCKGEPGLGKTLTAEIYSEVIEKPLYKVHSGQLGISPTQIEEKLKYVLSNAERWGAICLIDEADIFLKQRGDDLTQNAIVAVFLRTLEYFSGMLFLTTNRSNDIDDAILSRCIATIKYTRPDAESAKRIWKVLIEQYKADVDDKMIEELVKIFHEISGRDIKELLKLTIKYANGKNKKIDVNDFRICGVFRGLA